MLDSITEDYIDYSTEKYFSFGFRCERCGQIWKSEKVFFSTSNFSESSDVAVIKMLWSKQHDEAYERANTEAILHFNHCPHCKRWVCNDCFYIDPSDFTDICIDCIKSSRNRQGGKDGR